MLVRVAIDSPLRTHFDYFPPANHPAHALTVGMRARVPFRQREITGICIEIVDTTSTALAKIRPILEIVDETPLLPPSLLALMNWASHYYHHAIGEVVVGTLPRWLRLGRSLSDIPPLPKNQVMQPIDTPPTLNLYQQEAITTINKHTGGFHVALLDGVTGSGKTEVYFHVIEKIIQEEKQALVLVPEINLTPQLVARFAQRFTVPMTVLHSGLSDRDRATAWLAAKNGTAAIVIGTRSAIFTPFSKLGVIIVDEEHDLSFKQQEGFRYSARDLAIVRGQLEAAPIILGSATPSLESLHNAQQTRYQHLVLPQRVGKAEQPRFRFIDLRNQSLEGGLSSALLQTMKKHLDAGGQTLLFLNRRGYAPVLLCQACGWIANCRRCDASLTIHHDPYHLLCHHCTAVYSVVTQCANCQSNTLYPLGAGTERVELTLKKYFPEGEIVRIDRDSTRRKGAMEKILGKIHRNEGRILIGTQMLAKGHHFPDLTLVAIVNADNGLFSVDFRASERLAQLVLQVAGRAGRAEKPGEVLLQTYHPDHPLLQCLTQKGYHPFVQTLLHERQLANLPPMSYHALFRAEAMVRESSFVFLEQVRDIAKTLATHQVNILGPIPAPLERRANRFRAQLLLQAKHRTSLHSLLKTLIPQVTALKINRRVRWSLDVDPMEMG